MREKGIRGGELIQSEEVYNGTDKPPVPGKPKWYQTIDYDSLEIPFCIRPKGGGGRVDFFTFSNLRDKALEIKEACPHKFTNSNDVHRNAHYIGMYMLWQMHVKESKLMQEEAIISICDEVMKTGYTKIVIHHQFMKIFDLYVQGMISKDAFENIIGSMIKKADSEEIREWLAHDIERIISDPESLRRARNKLQMRDARAKQIAMKEEE